MDEYQSSLVVWDCQAWEGRSDVGLIIGQTRYVTNIPENVRDLVITLSARNILVIKKTFFFLTITQIFSFIS